MNETMRMWVEVIFNVAYLIKEAYYETCHQERQAI
jgi:hypothetical protein